MSTNNLAIKITADVVDLQTKFAVAKAEAAGLASEMSKLARAQAEGNLSIVPGAYQELAHNMLEAKSAAAGYSAQIKEATGASAGFGESLESIRSTLSGAFQLAGVGVAIEGVRELAGAIEHLGDSAIQIKTMSDVLGVTTGQFQAMEAAAEGTGVPIETVDRAAEKLKVTLDEARDGSGAAIEKLKELGLTNEQISSSTFSINDLLGILAARLRDSATHAETMGALSKELGARAAQAAEAIQAMDTSLAGEAKALSDVNAYSDAQISRLKELAIWWKEAGTSAEREAGKILVAATTNAPAVSNVRVDRLAEAREAAQAQAETAAAAQSGAAAQTQALTDVVVSAQRLYPEITAESLKAEHAQVEEAKEGTDERLALAQKYYQDSLHYYPGGETVDKVQAAHKEMIESQRAWAQSDEELTTQAEQLFEHATERREQTYAEMSRMLSEDARKAAEDQIRAAEETTKAIESATLQAMEIQQLAAKGAGKGPSGDPEAEYQATVTTLGEELSARMDYYDDKEAAAQGDLVKMMAIAAQEAEAQKVYLQGVVKAQETKTAEVEGLAKKESSAWKTGVGEIESAESTLISDVLSRRKSLSQSLIQVSSQLVEREIANDVKAMTTKLLLSNQEDASAKAMEQGGLLYHAAVELAKTLATHTGVTARTGAITAGGTAQTAAVATAANAQKAVSRQVGSSTVMSDAAKAFSGTYAGVAQIPYVGWILAPAAASVAFAAVAGYEALASLDVGAWNVPQDMVANIHAGESVVPTSFAEGMRQNGGFGGGEGGGGDTHHYWNISAWDGRSVEQVLKQHFPTLIGAARSHISKGGR
jgi:hypothetical protein